MKRRLPKSLRVARVCCELFTALILVRGSAYAAPADGDFDNDGLSDLSNVVVDRTGGTTSWVTRRSSGGPDLFYNFSTTGDALVTGRFFGGTASFPGVVHVRDTARPLDWRIKQPDGSEVALQYGSPGDGIPNQGDLDCDGVTDLIVTRNGNSKFYPGFKLWYIALSALPGTVQGSVFGLDTDRVAVADIDGDGCAEMVVLRDGFNWFSKKLFAPEVKQVQWGLPGDIPLLPKDLNADGQADYVVVRASNAGQTAFVRYSDSFAATYPLGGKSTVPMLGDFYREGPNFAWVDRSSGTTTVRQPDGHTISFSGGAQSAAIVRPDGTVVQPNENGTFKTASADDDSNGAPCDRFYPARDGKDKFVFKPFSDGIKTDSSILFPTIPFKDRTPIAGINLWHDGDIVGKAWFKGYTNPDRPTWHLSKHGDQFPKDLTFAVSLKNGQVMCIYIADPGIRWD